MNLYNLLKSMITKINNHTSRIEVVDTEIVQLENVINNIGQTIYPIGSIYMSTNSTSPAALFGGTWERIEDVFLFGASDTIIPGTLDGEAEHTLTEAEMPKHSHAPTTKVAEAETNNQYYFQIIRDLSSSSTARRTVAAGEDYYLLTADTKASDFGSSRDVNTSATTASIGESQPHNNMPPYLAIYMYKRVA